MKSLQRDHFPTDYWSAREAFRDAAKRISAVCAGTSIAARSARGEELTVDTAYLGPKDPEKLLVFSSGLHGVEGFAGSAIQHQLLTQQIADFELASDTGLLLIHALNPFGFSELRRVNENNVDLNRNFIRHPEDHPNSADYEKLFDAINPTQVDPESEEASRKTLLEFDTKHGFRRLQEVLSSGQHKWATGVQFGGFHAEESNQLIRALARDETRGASRIAWIDFHTGLGEFSDYQMITSHPSEHPQTHRGRRWYGDVAKSLASGESVSAVVEGTVDTGIEASLPTGTELTFFAAEFGTYEPTRVFWAMRMDNWLQHHGDPDSSDGQAIKAEIVEVFSPDDAKWKARVLESGARVLDQARVGLLGTGP